MQLGFAINIRLDENQNEKCIYIIYFDGIKKRWKHNFCNSQCGSCVTRHHMATYAISIATIDPSCKYTCK